MAGNTKGRTIEGSPTITEEQALHSLRNLCTAMAEECSLRLEQLAGQTVDTTTTGQVSYSTRSLGLRLLRWLLEDLEDMLLA